MTSPRLQRMLVIACVVAVAVTFAVSYGVKFGERNQQTYLVDALVRADPELYRRDWYVSEIHHHHFAFAYLTAPLFLLDADGPIPFGIAHIIVMVATFGAIYALGAAVTSRARLLVFIGVVGLIALGARRSLGGSYLYSDYFQPSSLAALAWLVAMTAWIRDRVLLAGIVLAAGAVFHLNYALLGIGVFGLCELVTNGLQLRRLAKLICPSLIVLLAFLPTLIASSQTSESGLALDVLQFAFPGHFEPERLRFKLVSLTGWQLIALALRPADRSGTLDRLFWLATVIMTTCIVAVVLVSIPPLLPLTRLFVWRIAPVGVLATLFLLFVSLRDIARGDRARPNRRQLAALAAGASMIIINAVGGSVYQGVLLGLTIACAVTLAVRREQLVTATCAALCAFALWQGRSTLIAPVLFDSLQTNVTKWARTSSPRDSVFLIPPYYGEFRLQARRGVVIDLKSPPMYLDELVGWYRRLCATVDAPALASMSEAIARWNALPPDRLVAIARRFEANYVVLDKRRNTARLTAPVAFEDRATVVYAIQPNQ